MYMHVISFACLPAGCHRDSRFIQGCRAAACPDYFGALFSDESGYGAPGYGNLCPSLVQNFFALIPLALILGEVTEDLAVRWVAAVQQWHSCQAPTAPGDIMC